MVTVPQTGDLTYSVREEFEPLGQAVEAIEPPQEIPPSENSGKMDRADEAEWHCDITKGDFWAMPTECKVAALKRGGGSFDELHPTKYSVIRIVFLDSPMPKMSIPFQNSPSENVMAYAKRATDKPKGKTDDEDDKNPDNPSDTLATVEVSTAIDLESVPGDTATVSGLGDDIYEGKDDAIKQAGRDIEGILSKENDCSDFFGENWKPAFDALILKLTPGYPNGAQKDTKLGIRQSSPINWRELGNTVPDGEGRLKSISYAKYRVFNTAVINRDGPFYNPNSQAWVGNKAVKGFRGYRPTSRQSRALQILHELAHLIYKNLYDETPLIKDDKGTDTKSKDNTKKILEKCKDEIDKIPN